jgi:putative ABC transport system permease protein
MPGFYETLGAKMVLGRPIADQDTAATRKVAVINEAFARKFFKNQNPLGQHFGIDKIKYSATFEIVGVVKDMRYLTYDYKDPVRPMFWLPEAQTVQYEDRDYMSGEIWSHYLYNIVIWAPGNPPGMEERVRKALATVDPNLVLYAVDPYTKVVSADFQQENMIATLTTLFGVLGLMLAAIGLYGVMAYMVAQRTREIGIRMALGATQKNVAWLVLREIVRISAAGLGIGLVAAFGLGKLIESQLFGVKASNPLVFLTSALLLSTVALLAGWLPARKAASVDPMVALRYE